MMSEVWGVTCFPEGMHEGICVIELFASEAAAKALRDDYQMTRPGRRYGVTRFYVWGRPADSPSPVSASVNPPTTETSPHSPPRGLEPTSQEDA